MALICRSKRYLTKPVRILLFKSLVMSHLNYCSSIYSNAAKSLISPLITKKGNPHCTRECIQFAHRPPIWSNKYTYI
jgi:hypothetical protein